MESKTKLAGAKGKGRPGVPKHAADRIRELIEELLQREPYRGRGGITRLAEALDISQPAVSMIRDGGGVAQETAIALAKLTGVNLQELVGGAYVGIAIGGQYPNLDVCLAYHVDRWSPAAVAAVRARLWSDEVSPDEWSRRLDTVEKALDALKGSEDASNVHGSNVRGTRRVLRGAD